MGNNKDMRFDLDARVEIWVNQSEIEEHSSFEKVIKADVEDSKKIEFLKEIARKIASDKIDKVRQTVDITITCELSLIYVNIDRVNWYELLRGGE